MVSVFARRKAFWATVNANSWWKKSTAGFKHNTDGFESPCELNINYLSEITEPSDSAEVKARKFIAAQSGNGLFALEHGEGSEKISYVVNMTFENQRAVLVMDGFDLVSEQNIDREFELAAGQFV